MGDKIKPHPSDCATCAPGSPAFPTEHMPHAASNAAISEQFRRRAAAERVAAEQRALAVAREHVTRGGAAGAVEEQAKRVARAERWYVWACDAWLNDADVGTDVAQQAAQAFKSERQKLAEMVGEGEALASVFDERDEARAVRANQEATIEDLGEALASALDERDEARAKLAEYQAGSIAVRLAEVERERDEALAARRSALYEARAGWRASERLRAQSEGEVARLRCFAEGLAQGLSVPAAGASSGLCRVCLTARPPLAVVATVTTRGASGEVLHFCEECWGLTAAGHSGVAR